jgi:hypothetical protein
MQKVGADIKLRDFFSQGLKARIDQVVRTGKTIGSAMAR